MGESFVRFLLSAENHLGRLQDVTFILARPKYTDRTVQ